MTYTNVFGGNTIYPSDVSYLALALDANTTLEWPMESSGTLLPAARIIDVTPDAAGWVVTLPDATLTGAGQTLLFNNLSGTDSFYVRDNAGGALATIDAGEQWELYLAATTTAAGTWRVFRFGASTATVQPSSLAGFGLTTTNTTLSQALPVINFNTTGVTVATSNRASAFVWTGTGAGTLNLLGAATAGNNFFVLVRNEGGGDLTLDPAGSETINSSATLVLRPGDSATVITDGLTWYTVGLGQQAVFAFDYTSITVTGGTYTLAGSELNRIAYKFVGVLTSDVTIIVPATVQQYWVNNATSGAYNLFIRTAAGAPTAVNQGAKGIYYCDGNNMVLASDPTSLVTPITVNDGGTGSTTASGARLNLGITAFADPIVTATTGSAVRTVIGAAASGANSDITSLSNLTTPLSIAQGGTDASTASGARTNLGLGTIATQNANNVAITGGSISGITDLAVADGGTGSSTASGARTNLGATTVGGNIFTLTNPSAITFLRVNADNTVSALNAADFRTAIGASSTGGTVTSVSGTGTVNGITLTGTVTSSGSLTLGGTLSGVSLTTQVTDTLPIGNGGTGSTTASGARTSLGATTVGANIFTLTNPSAITFLRLNADNTVSALNAADFRTAIGAATGTVTSVSGTGTVNGITLTGTVTSSGSLTLGGTLSGVSLTTQVSGTLPVGNGGTGATTLTGILKGNGTSAFTAVTAPSGALVGTTDTQDLSNKTLTTGNTLNAGTSVSDTGTIAATSPGFRGIPQNSQTSGYTLALTDAGKHISITTGGVAIPANGTTAFPVGTTIVVYNNSSSSQNITITTDTLRLAGTSSTGTRALAQRGLATLVKVASTEWVASGAGLT